MPQTSAVPARTINVAAATPLIRALFGPQAAAIVLESSLTEDPPRSLYATGLRVCEREGTELAVPWDAYPELAINEHDADKHPCLLLDSGGAVPLQSPEAYAAALDAHPTLIGEINDLLLDLDTPFDLVQALNNLCAATGWERIDLPPAQPSRDPQNQ